MPPQPQTYQSLLFTSASSPPTLTTHPFPSQDSQPPPPGTLLVAPLWCWIPQYAKQLYTGGNPRGYPIPFPLVPGSNAVARVLAPLPPDATRLRAGDLVLVEPAVQARDHDPISGEPQIMLGVHSSGFDSDDENSPGKILASPSLWRHGLWTGVARVPLENARGPVDAARFLRCQPPGTSLRDLAFYAQLAVPYGGLRDVGLRPGETVVVCPATGNFGGAAVHVAVAMGAGKVVAMGRDAGKLEALRRDLTRAYGLLAPHRVETVALTGTAEGDLAALRAALGTTGPDDGGRRRRQAMADVFVDFSPPSVPPEQASAYFSAALTCLRPGGRVSLSGGLATLPPGIPYAAGVMGKGLTLKGSHMYTRSQGEELLRMLETGVLKVGEAAGLRTAKVFPLEEWEMAFESAGSEGCGVGRAVYFGMNSAE